MNKKYNQPKCILCGKPRENRGCLFCNECKNKPFTERINAFHKFDKSKEIKKNV